MQGSGGRVLVNVAMELAEDIPRSTLTWTRCSRHAPEPERRWRSTPGHWTGSARSSVRAP